MRKLTLKYIKGYFERHGCELLEKEYVNCKLKMKYRCSCGNISKIRFDDFKQGYRCNECSKRTHEDIFTKLKGEQYYIFRMMNASWDDIK